jgi:hypothetical protein
MCVYIVIIAWILTITYIINTLHDFNNTNYFLVWNCFIIRIKLYIFFRFRTYFLTEYSTGVYISSTTTDSVTPNGSCLPEEHRQDGVRCLLSRMNKYAIREIDKEKELKIIQNLICNDQCLTNVVNRIQNTNAKCQSSCLKRKRKHIWFRVDHKVKVLTALQPF